MIKLMKQRELYKTLFVIFSFLLFAFSSFSLVPLQAVDRVSIYNGMVARRDVLSTEVNSLKALEEEIKVLQQTINSEPFNEAARAEYDQKVADGVTRSAEMQTQIRSYNEYITFITPAFTSQGTGWANLFFNTLVPNFSQYVSVPGNEVKDDFQDPSATFPIPAFPTAPTIVLTADKTTVSYGETVALTATTTGSGTLTMTWATDNGTLSSTDGNTNTLTAPTGTDGKDIIVNVNATVANKKDSASETIQITVTAGDVPTVKITSPTAAEQVRVPWGQTRAFSAEATGSGNLTVMWTAVPTDAGVIGTEGTSVIFTAITGTDTDPDISVTISATVISDFGTQSSPDTRIIVVGTSTTVLMGDGGMPLGILGNGGISEDLTGTE